MKKAIKLNIKNTYLHLKIITNPKMIWQGTKVGTYILVSIMAPFGIVRKKKNLISYLNENLVFCDHPTKYRVFIIPSKLEKT